MVAAFFSLIAIDKGNWRLSYIWLFVCLLIDGIDGTLARKFKVTDVLPNMHGKSIDYVVDFVTYMVVPAFFFYKAEMATEQFMIPTLVIIILSSALYYGKNDMVEDDQYFIGFPVLWNVVVYFLFFVFQNNQILNMVSVAIFGVLHFIPLRFAYPSRARKYFKLHMVIAVLGMTAAAVVIWSYPVRFIIGEGISLCAAIYFFVFAIFETIVRK